MFRLSCRSRILIDCKGRCYFGRAGVKATRSMQDVHPKTDGPWIATCWCQADGISYSTPERLTGSATPPLKTALALMMCSAAMLHLQSPCRQLRTPTTPRPHHHRLHPYSRPIHTTNPNSNDTASALRHPRPEGRRKQVGACFNGAEAVFGSSDVRCPLQ